MANATVPLIPADGTLTITDGAALSYTIVYEDGDFAVTGLKKGQMAHVVGKDRGIPVWIRDTERDESIAFSFSCHAMAVVGDNTTATIGDIIMRLRVWAAFTSTLPTAGGDTYCVTLTFTGERTNFGATADTTMVLKYCHLTGDFSEGIPGKWSIKGEAFCYSTDYLTATG